MATKKDFETRNRKKFCARIATGDYDAVIIGHSQFERIPVSRERQERLLQEQIWEIEDGISELKASRAERFTIKELERTKKNLEAKLQKLHDAARKDDVVTFEQLGVDRLYVDEAHSFKNLFLYTKMRNVAGLSTTDAQKSSDMLLKCRYIDEITHGKGVTFATGTPISNSMTELYTMMRYLQHDMLKRNSLTHFDCWASAFGETTTAIELAPEGTGYRARTRFAKFFNLPELMNLFREAADIKTSDQLNLPTPTPVYHNEVSQPTPLQQQMVQELSERAAKVHAGIVDASTDNMLKITSDGRKLGLDQRVINPDLPDDPNSKVNRCVDNIHRIWQDGQADRLTQLVFCDLSTPKGKAAQSGRIAAKSTDNPELHALEAAIDAETGPEEPPFTIYDDIREKLVARGIPREQIAFIHEANTETRKKELFAKVRSGQVRVLMGSTFKMGAGMNVQDRLVALHDLDCPWRPGDLEQRSGRIIRQGNRNKEVHIYRYVTESTFDAYLWQTVENKQKFISQIMTSKSPVRSCEDIDEAALSYAEIKALCAGDERIREKMDLDVDVARLRLMKANHQSQQYRLEDNILRHFPAQIEENKGFLSGFEADMKTLEQHPHPKDGFAGMEVKGDFLTDKDNAGAAILEAFKDAKGLESVPIGTYRGFSMSLTVELFGKYFILTLKGRMSHRVELGKDARGNLVRIDNALAQMPERYKTVQDRLENVQAQLATAKAELGKPFPQEDELRTKSARLAELNAGSAAKIEEVRARKEGSAQRIRDKEAEIAAATGRRMQMEGSISQQTQKVRTITDQREKMSQEMARLAERKANAEVEYDQTIAKLWEEYQLTMSDAQPLCVEFESVTELRRQVGEVRGKIRGLGNVNVGSIEEYKEVSERYGFLAAQVRDVEKSKAELTRMINELSGEMKSIFGESFKQINGHFGRIFHELFGGGTASLSLSDPDNVLESGIDIQVAPPGKVIKNLSALSGGEQALVAISIYFAILAVNPAPFCILDEIEAALDDVNVVRYAQYLRRITGDTQFIVITHRRGTMEAADVLYGVTMQQDGVSKLLRLDLDQVDASLVS